MAAKTQTQKKNTNKAQNDAREVVVEAIDLHLRRG